MNSMLKQAVHVALWKICYNQEHPVVLEKLLMCDSSNVVVCLLVFLNAMPMP